jgi:hypothetical protein
MSELSLASTFSNSCLGAPTKYNWEKFLENLLTSHKKYAIINNVKGSCKTPRGSKYAIRLDSNFKKNKKPLDKIPKVWYNKYVIKRKNSPLENKNERNW